MSTMKKCCRPRFIIPILIVFCVGFGYYISFSTRNKKIKHKKEEIIDERYPKKLKNLDENNRKERIIVRMNDRIYGRHGNMISNGKRGNLKHGWDLGNDKTLAPPLVLNNKMKLDAEENKRKNDKVFGVPSNMDQNEEAQLAHNALNYDQTKHLVNKLDRVPPNIEERRAKLEQERKNRDNQNRFKKLGPDDEENFPNRFPNVKKPKERIHELVNGKLQEKVEAPQSEPSRGTHILSKHEAAEVVRRAKLRLKQEQNEKARVEKIKSNGNKNQITQSIEELHKSHYVVTHNGETFPIEYKLNMEQMWKNLGDASFFVFSTEALPKKRFMPSVGNGHIAAVVGGNSIFMNGLYNGQGKASHRARIPNFLSINITTIEPVDMTYRKLYSLNAARGVFTEVTQGDDFMVEQRTYAHRQYNRLMVHEIDVLSIKEQELEFHLTVNAGPNSEDINFVHGTLPLDEKKYKNTVYLKGQTLLAEVPHAKPTPVHVIYDTIPTSIKFSSSEKRMKWTFLFSASTDYDDALNAYNMGAELIRNYDSLIKYHSIAWLDFWEQGSITMTGSKSLAKATFAGMYYLLSSVPIKENKQWPFYGLAPTGLATGNRQVDYKGHVFWDQEMWMYPILLLFHPEIAKTCLKYRTARIKEAKENAQRFQHDGAQFPWESAFSGSEVTDGMDYAKYEQHISGDISFAIRRYMFMTRDEHFYYHEGGKTAVTEISKFWMGRLNLNKTSGLKEILGVMPPDEYHHKVDNSVYTNVIAKYSIENPAVLNEFLRWTDQTSTGSKMYAENIYIPFDEKNQYHPEFDGYKIGSQVKQADVVLLGYPLMWNMSKAVRRKDIALYSQATVSDGPSMTWSMYAIGWLELKNTVNAWQTFVKMFEHLQGPFWVMSELNTAQGAVNFLTGYGGFLQTVVYGYGGFRIKNDRLDFDPQLPPQVGELNITGVNYMSSSFNFMIRESTVHIIMKSTQPTAPTLKIYIYETESYKRPHINTPVVISRGKAALIPNFTSGDLKKQILRS